MSGSSTELNLHLQTAHTKRVLTNKNYVLLLLAQLVSDFGDGVYALGLLWAMKILTGSGVQMSMVLVAEMIPMIVLGIFAGVFVDLGNKKKYMLFSDLFRAVITMLLGLLWMTDVIVSWHIIMAAILLSSFSAFYTPARTVAIRTLIADEQIMQAQSYSQTVQTVVSLVAPAVAAIIMNMNVAFAFFFNAASFVISFLLILLIKHKHLTSKAKEKLGVNVIMNGLRQGFSTILTVPILRNLIVYLLLLNLMFAPVTVLFPVFADSTAQLAVYETVFAIGVLLGSIGAGFLGRMRKIVPLCIGLASLLVSFYGLSIVHGVYLVSAFMLLLGMGSPVANITLSSLFVGNVPKDILGRASSMVKVLIQSASPISLSLTASLLFMFNVRELFMIIAIVGFLILIAIVMNPIIRNAK